jgi:hypothetical protein
MANAWYIARDGQIHGPITVAEFAEFIRRGHLLKSDYVWHDGLDDWLLGQDLLSEGRLTAQPAIPISEFSGAR